ncbi:DEAD/DEAH box helicase [Marinicella gelatinilytica]|uniref:DEAD/DEAH box helicase n=1 Tax=Marinicella gelatinilytica TaxID=2996017 RepID=UPI002260BCC0|nr:type ISP restriction/modification enzyme [Marinicella gelatinilytica]MCX7545509.1 DEAD/DEAH box helicase family protein [Marinicella gelatinilytica]
MDKENQTPLQQILNTYRSSSKTEREKGTYFEKLIITFFKYEARYKALYSDVWTYSDWATEQGISGKDTGIDLVAKTKGTDEYHAIQCKLYDEGATIYKKHIDSFFTASGKKPFSNRLIVTTTNNWSDNALDALEDQRPPVSKIDLKALEESQIDWSKYIPGQAPVLLTERSERSLRKHQERAFNDVVRGFKEADRGKMIMACGTGKTYTSLKLAEHLAGPGKNVLFLVPSLNLLSQTLTEWTQFSETPITSFAVCSDSDVGKKQKGDDRNMLIHELEYPSTTEASKLGEAVRQTKSNAATKDTMTVIFSTYHSIDVISKAQKEYGLDDFSLIICDEAHRTTGATFESESESKFVKVHNNDFIRSDKRLYMTATPRIYADIAKATAETENTELCSMDDEVLYGRNFHVINFSEAVRLNLLTDYKVVVLTIDEAHVSRRIQGLLSDENNSLKVDDAAKIIGCWKALSKQSAGDDFAHNEDPMKRAVAFCQVIEPNQNAKTHKVSSKQIAGMFQEVIDAYQEQDDNDIDLACETEHVDGSMNASIKESKLNWLKAEPPENTCRILSNVRCLSEGVDVPALDAVLFLTPRNSQVDVVQSVGRVMRNAPGKNMGYVILPVVIPAGMSPSEALNDNKVYKVVWDVLQALRSHDDQFDAMINKMDLMEQRPSKMEVVAITDKVTKPSKSPSKPKSKGQYNIGSEEDRKHFTKDDQQKLEFSVGEIERALYAKVVKKCGNRMHWEDWANDIAKIAKTHITRIETIVKDAERNPQDAKAFNNFADELRDDLNDSITDDEIIEMLAQHLITKPVFDALFEDYSFASNNPVSKAMQNVLDRLNEHHLDKEADTLNKFYYSVQMRAEGIDNAAGKQKIVVELYDKFFRNAFPHMTERLGIVYTPVEVVDFIIQSINDLLKQEFDLSLGDKDVHIIDPFTGTGTFITRLLQSGLITKDQLEHKYKNEIHANEIVLLAYYIAAINIEAVYHGIMGGDYKPFEGICLTDTFQMYEQDDMISDLLTDNSDRRKRQKKLDIRVIIGNPPYSAGQTSGNDNNANVSYKQLDESISNSYALKSSATNKNALYDSYIRAIRWASNQLNKTGAGIIGFVTNAGFLEANTGDGIRKCLAEEFSSIYVFHLRGNARTSGVQRQKEKDNVFGQGTRTPVAITIMVKNPNAKQHSQIFWHDIGDYLSQAEKLAIVQEFASIGGITKANKWQPITPDKYGDWVNQRDDSFSKFIVIGEKKNNELILFKNYSRGLATSRDAWAYNSSKNSLKKSICKTFNHYNGELNRYLKSEEIKNQPSSLKEKERYIADYFDNPDSSKIAWSRDFRYDVAREDVKKFDSCHLAHSCYRPFTKQWLYFHGSLVMELYQMPKFFPSAKSNNLVICVTGKGASKAFSALIVNVIPDLQLIFNGQGFPLYHYEKTKNISDEEILIGKSDKIDESEISYQRKNAITDDGHRHFLKAYPDENISKEDIFYYVYGLLHSSDYRSRFEMNLSKELPRIPRVKKAKDFWAFSQAGRDLAKWHLDFEEAPIYKCDIELKKGKKITDLTAKDYYVKKMKFARTRNSEGKSVPDKSTIVYNPHITLKNIPLEAYDYVVNGKSAIEWVMERQGVKTDKKSGITNDANDWAIETMDNPKYPLELLQRIITVSLETNKIVNSLPKLDI